MTEIISSNAYGIAAFAAAETLTLALCKGGGVSAHQLAAELDSTGKTIAARGITTNNDADTGAARLISRLISEITRADASDASSR